jgi:hypothetical protein
MADPIDVICRLDYRSRSFQPGARCSVCGLTWTILLHRCRGRIHCYRCLEVSLGRAAQELHHVGGDPSAIQVLVPANLHRVLSLWQDLTWRGIVEPASDEAIRLDLIALMVFGSLFPAVG